MQISRSLDSPSTLEFTANLVEILSLLGGRTGAVLAETFFYPTGGGQEHDTGSIGPAQVIDVYKDPQTGKIVHVIDRPLPLGTFDAHIDPERRLRAMQNHTGQHLLTQCFLRLFDLDTLSANINTTSPSTLDLPQVDLSRSDLDRVEDLANTIIYENRPVKTTMVTPDQLPGLPLRHHPTVSENIRIVEIDGWDTTPCGGTHCITTGMIGIIKILKTERPKDKRVRVSFAAGRQALDIFRQDQAILSQLTGLMETSPEELPHLVARQGEALRQAEKTLQSLQAERLSLEAQRLAEQAQPAGAGKLVSACFERRPLAELRQVGEALRAQTGLVAALVTYDGSKASLLVTCGPGSPAAARQVLAGLLASFGGRGGGDASLAQGGGVMAPEAYAVFAAGLESQLHRLVIP